MNELILVAARSMVQRKKRTSLTMLGIFIGIAVVVTLVSIGQGLQYTIQEQFQNVGADKIIVQAKELGYGGQHVAGVLRKNDVGVVRSASGVLRAAGHLFRTIPVVFNDVQRMVYVMNVPEQEEEVELIEEVHTLEAEQGRLLNHKDVKKAVVGFDLAHKQVFQKNIVVGNKLVILGVVFDVVGVAKRIGDPALDATVTVSEQDAREILEEQDAFSMIVVQSVRGVDPELVAERIEKALRRQRHQKEGKEDFSVQTSTSLIEAFSKVLLIVQGVFSGIAAISLIVGAIGIMNAMYTAVFERTREIGVMKAVGARNRDVLCLFLFESGVIGFLGGFAGMIVGVLVSKGVEIAINAAYGSGTLIVAHPWFLVVGSVVFACVIGMVSGVLPARQAAKLKPVDALRYE